MIPYSWSLGWWVLLVPTGLWAQVPAGDGLQGAYYQGKNFEQYVSTRRDAMLDFDWHEHRPVVGVGANQFSARWTGWLVPPRTGRYVLHISVDDGIRLWVGERQLLDDWGNKVLNYYQVALDLTAGQAYSLRLDYCQDTAATRVRLAWELPPASAAARNWESLAESRGTFIIPTRYLFSKLPTLLPVETPAAPLLPTTSPLPKPAVRPAAATSVLVVHPVPVTTAKSRPRSYLSRPPLSPSLPSRVNSDRVATVAARLAAGKILTPRTLYFEQGQAFLLPAAQASLDTLARALASRPALRLEVQGHTDNQGDPAINQQLSQRRAVAVCAYLAAHGVAASRLRAVGYGGSRPVADNSQPSQRPANRRVVLKPLVGRQ